MKSFIFWDIEPCSPLKVNRRFRVTCHFHLKGRRIRLAINQRKISWQARQIVQSLYVTKCTKLFKCTVVSFCLFVPFLIIIVSKFPGQRLFLFKDWTSRIHIY
jgi:hypothetical protein